MNSKFLINELLFGAFMFEFYIFLVTFELVKKFFQIK